MALGERLEVWVSPMTNTIYAGYTKHGIAIDKVDITQAALSAVAKHLDTEQSAIQYERGMLKFEVKQRCQMCQRGMTDEEIEAKQRICYDCDASFAEPKISP